MQEIVRNLYSGPNSLSAPLHLKTASNGDLFNHQSMLTSESDDCNSASEDFHIDLNQNPSQDFGLGYWMKHTNYPRYESPLPQPKSPKNSAFISNSKLHDNNITKKSNKPDISHIEKPEKLKKSRHNLKVKSHKKSKEKRSVNLKSNFNKSTYNIPKLKIPKDVVKKYLKTLSPLSTSSSSSSESESTHIQIIQQPTVDRNKQKSKYTNQSKSNNDLSDTPLSDHNNSSCLQTSFLSSNYSKQQSSYLLSASSHDNMLLSMTIDNNLILDISSLPVINERTSDSLEITDSPQLESTEKDSLMIKPADKFESNNEIVKPVIIQANCINDIEHSNKLLLLDENQRSLSTNCDNQEMENNHDNTINPNLNESGSFNHLSPGVNRKRLLCQEIANDQHTGVAAKKQMLEKARCNRDQEDHRLPCDMTVLDYVRFFMTKMKDFGEMMHDKYCLSQPNAMKFLAQNHAFNWESYKNDLSQLHLVPCEFIAEIFHRALHCFGLEKRTLKETLSVECSPSNRLDSSHSTEYKKVRDEYSFSLKRVRYGIGVIDDLFKRKINFQSSQPNSDVMVVRKWKHLIYYLCLQAKAVFMTKEMQYHNYANYVTLSGAFDGDCNLLFNTTPTAARCSSNLVQETQSKLQLSKDNSRIFDSKFMKTTPDHLSQFDMDVSPHSYDSGKGSSIRLSSNGTSQVSGGHTTSSLNSTPHSLNEAQLNLPGFHMYRIDQYLQTANEFVHFLPETLQLHNKIISKIGLEPNANSSDNMMRFINYIEVCQQICKQDAMSECLQRLLSQAVRL